MKILVVGQSIHSDSLQKNREPTWVPYGAYKTKNPWVLGVAYIYNRHFLKKVKQKKIQKRIFL